MPGERGHYKKAPRGPPTLWVVSCWGFTAPTPPTSTEGPSLCHNLPRVVPPFLSQGLQEPAGEGRCLRPESIGQRAEEIQAVPRVKVSWLP